LIKTNQNGGISENEKWKLSRKELLGKKDLHAPEAPAGRARSSGTLGGGPKSKQDVRRAKD